MTIKNFIESAIKGGWREGENPKWDEKYGPILSWSALKDKESGELGHGMTLLDKGMIFLDPKAWEAVGKVEKWYTVTWYVRQPDGYEISVPWMVKMYGMVEALQLGFSLEEYLKRL